MRKKELVRKITCWMTLGIFSLQPALTFAADIVADASAPEAQRPYVTETANGIPLVQIARPDGNDVSVNHYEAFSVPERGAILNNAFLFSNTQLAGYIEGNPNLSGGPARIIVNEVMSDRPSELRGFLEVAGTKADVIIANPNGIYADGAGFLNTSRAILAAGRTERDAAGGYAGLHIEDGRAYITGKGLDARGADSAEIYARAVAVNAGLWANHAKIVAGQNSIAKDGSISPITSETTSTAPQYAIDLADIGGMYANRITMVGTEKGLGVNLTGQLSATQAVSLDVNGNLKTTGSLYSDGDLSVHADRIENTNLIYGGKNASIRAKELTNKSGGRIYGDTVTINAEHVVNETDAALEARLTTEVHTLSQRAIEVEAAHRDLSTPSTSSSGFFRRRADLSKHLLAYRERIGQAEAAYDAQQRVVDGIKDELSTHPAGVIAAHSQLDVSANTIQNTGNALLYSGGDIALTAEETLKNSGARIEAQGSIAITAPHIENENAAFAAKRTITSAAVNPTKIRIDEPGHIEQGKAFPEWEFRNIDSGYGAYHSHIAKKPIYEHAAYEEIKQPAPAEIAAGEAPVPAELVGTLSPNYDYDDPIFKELGVASMSTPRPAHGDPAQAAWDAKYRIVLDTLNEKIDAYNREAEEYNRTTAQAAGQKIDLLTFIETADVHSKETVTSSLSAAIRAGNSITLHGDTANTDSTISAGGTFRIDGALTENAHQQQEQTVTLGTTRGSYTKVPRFHKGRSRYYNSRVYMTPEVVRANPTSIGVSRVEENAATETIEREQRQHIANTLSPFGLASAAQTADTSAGEAPAPEHISLSALYRVHPESTAKYLVETDPAFTDRKKFLSSDYMYNRLKWDPDKIPKRIGDGFYEQQLLADQILKQTGKRHLDGYTDDETAFKALMDAGITYAKEMNLSPGIKLSKEQIAALTSDMIWLEEREVYVNGKKERAVYPVLYTKNTQGLRLTKGGSLISARNIIVETKDALKNAGTLYGENIIVNAGEIENTGLIRAKKIGLTSESNIHVQGSVIGDKAVALEAKNDIAVESTTEKLAHQDVLNTTAGIAVKGDEGVLVVSAGKNIALAGATLAALGKNGSILLSAGENISLDTKKLQSEKDMTLGAENYLRTKRGTELGTEIQADRNISIAAGNDLAARAADIASKNGTTSLSAGNDISLTEGREISEDHYGIRYKESGLLSTKTTTIRTDTESDTAITSKVTGQNVSIAAKRDASFTASDIAADHDVTITAGRNVSAASADNYVHTEHFKSVKTSGIFSAGGGLGFTIGTQQTKTTQGSDGVTRQGTNIAALGGNVSISAGENAHISSSNILADKDANISAKETVIDGKSNIYRESITQESKTTGLTVSFSHGLLDLGQEFYAPLKRMGEVEDDRLKAAYALQARRLIREKFGKGKNPLKGQTFSLDISFGTSKSYSRMENTTTEYAGSRIASGRNTNITAGERALTVTGSAVTGNNVSLSAKGNVRLEAGENTSITTTENKFSSASIGASFTPSGLTDISISANKANGNSKESVTSYSPALVSAKNDLSLTSGKDMDIIGSKAQGEKITAKVGGSLNIETLQEKETYEEDNHSTGFGVSWNVNQTKKETTDANGDTKIETIRSFSKPTFSGSWNKGNIDSHYRSARDQAGFFAGKGGFDIYVEKNTDLKGAVIASEASPEKNKLTTGTLTFSDLENTASYKVSDKGVSLHVGGNVKPGDKGLLPATHMPIHGSASNVTKSAVSSGAIEILRRPIQDLAGLSRNTDNAQKPLEKIFDKDKILEQQEAAELFGELANRAVGDISERMHWKEGDPRKIFLKGLTAGIMNRIAGGSFGKGMTAGAVNELLIARLLSWQDAYGHPIIPMELLQGISYGAGMAIDGTEGAVIAQSGTKHNIFEHLEYFLDEQEREAFLKAVEACGGDEYEVAQVFEQGGYLQRALSRIGKTPTPGYEYKPIIYTKADGTKFVRIVEVEKNASTKTPDEDGFTKTNIIDDKNSSHTEERIYWGPWRRTTQIAEKPKADTENTNSNDGNATMPIQKDEANNKDILGKNQRDSTTERKNTPTKDTSSPSWKENKKDHQDENNGQGNQMRGADVKRRGSDQRSKNDGQENHKEIVEKGNKGIFDGGSNKGSIYQSTQTPNKQEKKIENQGNSSSAEGQKGTNGTKTKETVDPIKETVQNTLTSVETTQYNYLGEYKGNGALPPYARTGYRWFGRIGGISGSIFLGLDFYKDYYKYSGTDLAVAWGTDLIPIGVGLAGAAVGSKIGGGIGSTIAGASGTVAGPIGTAGGGLSGFVVGGFIGGYVGGIVGGDAGAYAKDYIRNEIYPIKTDEEKEQEQSKKHKEE